VIDIGVDGYLEYLRVDSSCHGKELTVSMPTDGGFAAYAKKVEGEANETAAISQLKAYTVVMPRTSVLLSEGDLLLFAAKAGDRFAISILNP
jgi:uncharacterized protein GlcG (DUF336 family)